MKVWSPWPKLSGARRSGSMPSSQSSNATFPTGDIEAVLTKRPALVKLTPENETTDEHRAVQPQPKRISPQRRGERRGCPWERTLPASSVLSVSNPPHAGCVRSLENAQKVFQKAKDFRVSSTDEHGSVFICGFIHTSGCGLR